MKSTPGYTKEQACIAEGWEVDGNNVWAFGKSFPLTHPLAIYNKVYRTDESHQTRFDAMKRVFEIQWPEQVITYNYWMERIFWEHCDHDTEFFSLAGGGGIGKTQSIAYVAAIFFQSLPHKHTVIVTSTTLDSLKSRIYGYVLRALKESKIKYPLRINNTPPPSIALEPPDFIHGIYGIAAKQGSEEDTIKNIIGRHPKSALMLILDEATEMPMAILNAVPNLKKGLADRFQAVAIGNPNSTEDLHGVVSIPAVGWGNIDPKKDFRWVTTQPNGVCLYFNPYDSPAIHETDPVKKKALSVFLMTEEKLIESERNEGVDSDGFWRFTMGFWKARSTESKKIVTEEFLKDYDPTRPAEFSGLHTLHITAGLDPAFSTGGDKCILRLAVLGHHVNGRMVLDYRGPHFVFHIKILPNTGKSAEIQIADQVIAICIQYQIPLNVLCIDASGQGRGLADVIQLRSGTGFTPTKIYSTNIGQHKVNSPDIVTTSSYEMWTTGKEFITNRQIHGLDPLAYGQLHTRHIIDKGGKKALEKKAEYKSRMSKANSSLGRSPDEADAAMLCLQSAILHFGFFPGQELEVVRYANEESRHYDVALKAYQEQLAPKAPYNPRAAYSKGIGSLLGKRSF